MRRARKVGSMSVLSGRSDSGVVRSRVVAGFAVPVRAVFDEDENLGVLAGMVGN